MSILKFEEFESGFADLCFTAFEFAMDEGEQLVGDVLVQGVDEGFGLFEDGVRDGFGELGVEGVDGEHSQTGFLVVVGIDSISIELEALLKRSVFFESEYGVFLRRCVVLPEIEFLLQTDEEIN